MKEKYFLYARKSTEHEDKQVQSIRDQINSMREKAKNLGIEIIDIFEESMSAKAPGRYRFNEMIQRLHNKEALGIIAWKIDRITRNPVDTGTIQYMLQNGGIGKIITNDREYNPVDAGLLFSVETGMSNQFILDLKKNVRRGMDSKTERGIFCGKAPEGYINNKLEKTIEIDPQRFSLVRRIWDLVLDNNYTIPQIVDKANNDWGFKTRKGGELKLSTTYAMLSNPFYTGDFLWKGEIKKGTHDSMVTYREFQRVQETLGEKGLNLRGKTKEFAYTGFIKCGECGSAITAEEKFKKRKYSDEVRSYVYYRCTKRKKGCHSCSQKAIPLAKLESQIQDLVQSIEIHHDFKKWAINILKEDVSNEQETQQEIGKSLQNSQILIEKRLNTLTDSLIDELIGKDEYKLRKKHLQIELEGIREQIGKHNTHKDISLEETERVFDFVLRANADFHLGTLQQKKEILRGLGLEFELKNQKLSIKLHKWFIPIQKLSKDINEDNARFELIKNSTSKGITDATNPIFQKWYPRMESNQHLPLRRGLFYPLNYKDINIDLYLYKP